MTRVLSGIQPTGDLHIGNYMGAVRNWIEDQHSAESFFCLVDLHALSEERQPEVLRAATFTKAAELLACGVDPSICTLFVQSHVAAHSQMCWLMESTASFGELRRMTQFKDKSEGQEGVRASLLTYPCLMAGDILLYEADRVPVGEDQRQHLELARDLAIRWNFRYGETFMVPEAAVPKEGARIMDLVNPTAKMSNSRGTGQIYVFEDPSSITRKIKRAVTDTDGEVRYDTAAKPGVSNLLQLLAAATGSKPEDLATKYTQYGPLKADTADAVVEMLRPAQARFAELKSEPDHVRNVLREGAVKAAAVADPVLARANQAIGLLSL